VSERITILTTLRSPISRKVALWVLLSIIAIEAVILVPSYLRREDELLRQLEVVGRTAVVTAFTNIDARAGGHKPGHASEILTFANAIGLAVFEGDKKIVSLGVEPEVSFQSTADDKVFRKMSPDGNSYNLGWKLPVHDSVGRTAFIRVDARHVRQNLQNYVFRIFGLALIISIFVTGVTMMALWPIVLRPMLKLIAHFADQEGHEPSGSLSSVDAGRRDEIGELYRAFQALVDRVTLALRASHSARDDLERQVAERTQELETLNAQLTEQITAAHLAEARFRTFTHSASDWYWEMDKDLRFSYFSSDFTKSTGMSPELLLGRTRQETGIPNVDPEAWAEHLGQLDRHERFRNFIHPREFDGHTSWLTISGEPVVDDDGEFQGYRGVGADISERVEREESVRQIEGQLRAFIDHSPSAIMIKDLEGRCLIANKAWHQWFNPDGLDISGQQVWDFYPADHAADIRKQDEAVIAANKSVEREINTQLPDGRVLATYMQKFPLLDASGKIVAIGGMNTDVTELRTASDRYRDLIEMSPDAIFIHRDRVVVYANNRANELYEANQAGGLVGQTGFDLVHPDFRAVAKERRTQMVNRNSFLPAIEMVHLTLEGNSIEVEVTGREIIYEGFPSVLIYAREIGTRKELQSRLAHAQKMEAVGHLTGGIAHDFNNLLAVMVGNAEVLEHEVGDNESARVLIEGIISAVLRGSALTNRLLAFSRQQSLNPIAADVRKLVGGLEDMLRRTLGETIDLRVVQIDDLWLATTDPHQLENALLNLAINARDAMPGGGMLTIEAANATLDDAYASQQEEVTPGDYIEVAVTDTGTGMTPEVLEKVFDPFFTTKEVGKGSGLGLSMVYGYAKQSGGHVTVYSEIGQGTTIKLYLPRSRDAEDQQPDRIEEAKPVRGVERILVVEDDPGVRDVSVGILQGHGYDVVEAADGAQAIDCLQNNTTFDMLFTDVVLPGGMNGVEIAEQAVQIQPGIKVLFTTGYAENAVTYRGKLQPGAALVNKPYRRAELLDKVRAMLDSGVD
jgi:PAS domain S-box-containing protein